MEINNPLSLNPVVTNGLLVKELISGKQVIGDTATITRRSADDIPIAGDLSNNDAPTYASLAKVASLNNDKPWSDWTGLRVNESLDKFGNVSKISDESGYRIEYVYFDNTLKHNIPSVFFTFMNHRGNVYTNGQLVNDQPVLGDNPLAPWLDATGFPITEAYWTGVNPRIADHKLRRIG
jgi:hypothetical protein